MGKCRLVGCSEEFEQKDRGRPRLYCSNACRQIAKRERANIREFTRLCGPAGEDAYFKFPVAFEMLLAMAAKQGPRAAHAAFEVVQQSHEDLIVEELSYQEALTLLVA